MGAISAFAGWENFYVIVGSSAGALIGLQFVVLTLISNRPIMQDEARLAGDAFATPSVVHFAVVLLLSAIVSAPWNGIDAVSALWGFLGLSGVVYTIIVVRRLRVQTLYRPVFEDWLFHGILPFAAYVMLAVSAWVAHSDERPGMFLVGGAALLLLFIGIHNAWDAVTFHVFTQNKEHQGAQRHR
jgi:hypothetical protein